MIQEGSALVDVKTEKTVSKDMEVFYNPVMKTNRDISVLLLKALDEKGLQIGLPLAGSGIRGVRMLLELGSGNVKSISFNDYSEKAASSIKKNLELNGFKKNNKKITIDTKDANVFLMNSKGFDYIDIDPFGTSNPFLDDAIRRISRNGILAVTNTDTAGLAGARPNVCKRLYWAEPKKDYLMHETGLRILIRKIQLVGTQYGKALIPIFSYFKDHYFRVFFRCVKEKKECDNLIKKHGMFNDAGPMWLGDLFDSKLVGKMHIICLEWDEEERINENSASNKKKSILKKSNSKKNKKLNENFEKIDNSRELLRFLEVIKEESKIKTVGFFDTHKKGQKKIIQKDVLISKLKKKGYKAGSTHFLGTGVRTNASEKVVKRIG